MVKSLNIANIHIMIQDVNKNNICPVQNYNIEPTCAIYQRFNTNNMRFQASECITFNTKRKICQVVNLKNNVLNHH